MTVDLEAIARRGRCNSSHLRVAIPLLEHGYTPPFLARYRRDELGGVDESTLWALADAIESERSITRRRDELLEAWQSTPVPDPAIGQAIRKANSKRMLDRLSRRLKREPSAEVDPGTRLAVRILNPQKGDGDDVEAIAAKVDGIDDPAAAVAALGEALPKRLAGDPRIVGAAVRWLSKNARVHISKVHDPHGGGTESGGKQPTDPAPGNGVETGRGSAETDQTRRPDESAGPTGQPTQTGGDPSSGATGTGGSASATPSVGGEVAAADEHTSLRQIPPEESRGLPSAAETAGGGQPDCAKAQPDRAKGKAPPAESAGPAEPRGKKKSKKVSPRQRRRRWLVSVLKPLQGKRLGGGKLSAFQVVMLGRALRSQVAVCSFEYDAKRLVDELQRTAIGLNRQLEPLLRETVLVHEANMREAAESAWWDELQEQSSARLVDTAADNLRHQINRAGADAGVVMSIDAIGPRTAATAIVSADGRMLHCEDIPCQLSSVLRTQAVAKIGELIHQFHVDLIVISNGPARRACMVALKDLIDQSPERSIRWTLADRSGADAYAGAPVADQELRTTSRRFRAAAWVAFSVMQPAEAMAKVDPLKLRLGSFQRELADDALGGALENVVVSGASRGGVDANSATRTWLSRLPGVGESIAATLDERRREGLFRSRAEIGALEDWETEVQKRQALPFLRVFGSEETLDGTLIHPEDYPLAKKLASALDIELPPATPPGYEPPSFDAGPSDSPADTATDTASAEAGDSQPSSAQPSQPAEAGSAAEPAAADHASSTPHDPSDAAAGGGEQEPEVSPSEGESKTSNAEGADPSDAGTVAEVGESGDAEAGESAPLAESQLEGFGAESRGDRDDPSATATTGQGATGPPSDASIAERPEPPQRVRRPLPERPKIDKCVKEWQIGPHRAHQLVHWLCDPFGSGDAGGTPHAVLSTMPTLSGLNEGDQVIGVVVGVMPFGTFVELAPDCSGLVHVSRISESFVEDIHEVVQVGDVITAWVTGIDPKKRRVALTAIPPERQAELDRQRQQRDAKRGGGGRGPRGGRGEGRGGRGGAGRSGGGQPAAKGETGPPRGKGQTGSGKGQTGSGKPSGAGRSQRGGGKGHSRDRAPGGRRGGSQKSESYRVVSEKPAPEISEAMKKGEEPLRSFGDLLRYYSSSTESTSSSKESKSSQPPAQQPETSAASHQEGEASASTEAHQHHREAGAETPAAATAGHPPQPPAESGPDQQTPRGQADSAQPAGEAPTGESESKREAPADARDVAPQSADPQAPSERTSS